MTSWTAPARPAAGERVVLKVGWRHDEALHEADGLAAWDGDGAVRLLDHRVLDHTTALLLDSGTWARCSAREYLLTARG